MHTRLLLLSLLALLHPPWAEAASNCVVLQYHHVSSDTPASTSISLEAFRSHLELIESLDMRVLSLRKVIQALQQNHPLPDRCLSLTFDDAYRSVFTHAWPLLRQRGWPFTVFVPTDAIDRHYRPYMTWAQIHQLAASGVDIENHSRRHDHLIRQKPGESEAAWRQRIVDDLSFAQQRLSRKTGQTPTLFAWPYGEYLPELSDILATLGLTGFGQQSGAVSAFLGWTALPRFPVSGRHARLNSLKLKLLSLPMPLRGIEPESGLVEPNDTRPALTLELDAISRRERGTLRCYIDGSPAVEMSWLDDQHLRIRPKLDLKPGRHRVNCTLPSRQSGRYHWFSHLWFIRNPDGSWYAE